MYSSDAGEPEAGPGTTLEGRWARANVTGGRVWLWVSTFWRYTVRATYRAVGRIERLVSFKGWWPFAKVLGGVVIFLAVAPVALHYIVSALKSAGMTDRWGIAPAPDVKTWLTPLNVGLLFMLVVFMRWLGHARERVVVEGFIDHTKEDAKAVSGLSTLLVTELTRLRELYREVNAGAVPTAVGVERHGGFARGKEAAPFLTVSADDVSNVLEGAIASDARLEVGPAKIPIGPMLTLLNRIARGPRVVGSVHLTEAGGGPTLTAQLVSGRPSGTWRVDEPQEPESAAERKAFLDTMVRELACRIFTELTLGATVRWQAIQAFNEYLRLYGEARRTPRDRAHYLKQAQGKLLEAVAEDETFDLAYYNLGVTYRQLEQAEQAAERASDDLTSPADFRRTTLGQARREAADVAFKTATEKNPARWEGHYALAVTRLSALKPIDINDPVADWNEDDKLHDVIRRCDQALAVGPPKAAVGAVHDLRGMAQTRIGEFGRALASHRTAVRHSWMELCRAERDERARPHADRERLQRAIANAAAALHNMGLARARRAEIRAKNVEESGQRPGIDVFVQRMIKRDRIAAARIFQGAIRIAGEGTPSAAASHFERARVLEKSAKFDDAANGYKKAELVHPRNSEYVACRARTLAAHATSGAVKDPQRLADDAREVAERALRELAPVFGRSVVPFAPTAFEARCKATLTALNETFEALVAAFPDSEDRRDLLRVRMTIALHDELQGWCDSEHDFGGAGIEAAIVELERAEARWALRTVGMAGRVHKPAWELAQVELALSRLYVLLPAPRWQDAARVLDRVLSRCADGEDAAWLIGLDVRAHYASALRHLGHLEDALSAAAECVRRDPLSVGGRREAGRAHFALCEYDNALDAWQHALFLNPSDAYLHFEIAMCHRRIAQQRSGAARAAELEQAAAELEHALAFFDGEDLNGEGWTRVWRGRVALERGRTEDAIADFEAGTHGNAAAAASLFLAEAYLRRDRYKRAEEELARALQAFMRSPQRRSPRQALDAKWGGELPQAAFHALRVRALAHARHMAPGDWQDPEALVTAEKMLSAARRHAELIDDERVRDDCLAVILESEVRALRMRNRFREALALTRKRLQMGPTAEEFELEAELLELLVAAEPKGDDQRQLLLAAERAWHEAELGADGRAASHVTREHREWLRRAIKQSRGQHTRA